MMEEKDEHLQKFANAGAWFKLIFGCFYAAFSFIMVIIFFRARNVFEIRARSAYLVTFLGLVLLISQGLNLELHLIVLFHIPDTYYRNNLVVFFYTFTVAFCYIGRVVRLAVGYSPKLRKAVPWLMSERLLITISLTMGVLSMTIPLYYRHTIKGDDWEREFIEVQRENIWICTVALQALQAALLPVVWSIDDLFHISRELIVIIFLGLIQSVVNKLSMERMLQPEVAAWINPPNMGFLVSCILLGLTIIDPVRRLVFNPMATTSPILARACARSERVGTQSIHLSEDSFGADKSSASSAVSTWSYEKIAESQTIAEAFRTFANRALCQESVLFLEDVRRFNKGDYGIGVDRGGSQIAAFEAIVKRYVIDGAPYEINIGCKDRNAIILLFNTSTDTFDSIEEAELRVVLDRAYAEVRYMLESNILSKFITTEDFRKAVNTTDDLYTPRRQMICCLEWPGEGAELPSP